MAYTTIDKPSDYFETKLYAGNSTGSTQQAITGLDFSPNMVWIKPRSDAEKHSIADTVRGATKTIHPHLDEAEETSAGHMVSFDANGYTVGVDNYSWNKNGSTYASWNWKAGGSASTNENGSITSSVSANQDVGFSIVSYTGNATDDATVGHGLSSAPQMVITKSRGDAGAWQILTNIYPSYSEGDYIALNTTDAEANSANVSFLPTSTTWQMKSGQAGNTSSTKIAYCFHSVQGYSKFSTFVGNANADGTFVYLGFKPAFFIIKKSSGGGTNWVMFDNKRIGYNESNYYLRPSGSNAESTNIPLDILSNGFKIRTSAGDVNASGATYIYMAFAENPFTTSTGVPATAR